MPPTLVAFTSAQGDRPLYRRDALNALACPERWVLSLSYRQKWIAEDLEEDLNKNRLVGQRLLIVVCGGALDPDKRYQSAVPLRFCKVISTSLRDDGSQGSLALLYVESDTRLTLDPAVGPDAQGVAAVPGAPPFALLQNIVLPRSFPEASRDQGDSYLRRIDLPNLDRRTVVGLNDHIEELRQRIPELAGCWHFFLTEITEVLPSFASRLLRFSSRPHGSAMTLVELQGGKLYQMQFYLHRDTLAGTTPGMVELVLNGEHAEVSQPVVRQHGSGAVVQYLLSVPRTYAVETVNLLVRMRRQDMAPTPPVPPAVPPAGPELQLLLQIRPFRGFWLLLIVLLTFGTLGLNMSKEALQGMSLPATEAYVLGAKALGGLIVSLAGWIAFRRLPIKI
jgi:hypothetical protein